uniref:Aldehyde oxidase/xanthine dehydrogenase first molybdopterin binding domain-containing protein n=1 Tax=Burkholderia cenocepacia TaxID=95486 RepID=A0A071MJP9_9BURK
MPAIADGDSAKAKAARARTIEASYSMPHTATNPPEPINVTVFARNGGTPAHCVTLHERVSGGSFGARESTYWLFEAAWCAVKASRPVKLMNSRKDGAVKMERLTCVADCGSAVSPAGGDE